MRNGARAVGALSLLVAAGCAGRGVPAGDGWILYACEEASSLGGIDFLRAGPRDGAQRREIRETGHVYALRATPSGTAIAVIADDLGVPEALREIDASGRVLWEYDWPAGKAGITHMRAAEALPGGTLLVSGTLGEWEEGRGFAGGVVVEMARDGRELRRLALGPLSSLGAARPMGPDAVLVAADDGAVVLGWDGEPREVPEFDYQGPCRDAVRMPDGGWVLATVSGVVFATDARGRQTWAAIHDRPVNLQALPGGTILVAG